MTLAARHLLTSTSCLPLFLSVFHVAPPSSPAHLPRQPWSSVPRQPCPASFTSLTSSRLQDKHQKLRESRRVSSHLPSLPPPPPASSSPVPPPFHCYDDLTKPKGKRPCKTKHTGGEAAREEERDEGGTDDEEKSGKVSDRPWCNNHMMFCNQQSSTGGNLHCGCSARSVSGQQTS